MFKQKIFIISFIVLVLIAVLNYFGAKFYLYWAHKWYDIPMHILGGLWISTFFLSLYTYFNKKNLIIISRTKIIYLTFFVLLFIIILWEIFELFGKMTFLTDNEYWVDTIQDIFNGYLGGIIGYYLFTKNKKTMLNERSEIN
ncbi:MAG: hypothetical protein V1910_00835 [bacterium]